MKRVLPILAGAVVMAACEPTPPPPALPPTPPNTPKPVPTPHPAQAASEQAIQLYPDLAKPDSRFNRAFREMYEQEKIARPKELARMDWPLDIARRTGEMLGIEPVVTQEATPVPKATPAPVPAPSPTALGKGAYNEKRGVTRAPYLPGVPRNYRND
jgi:hypothetical protein